MPLPEKQLRAREAKRDLGAELLVSIREMNAAQGAVVGRFPTTTKKTRGAKIKPPPRVVIFAGPNGAGKSTNANAIVASLGINTFVNADYIARGLSGLNSDQIAMQAGRIMLTRLKDLQRDNLQIKEPKLWLKLQNLIKTA